ncbi:MAG TPA: PHP domain-containing protein, partial [Candidatus Krumholzibacteria bacterium]|nr:PHP domain-containing protein [Candidatus Krumholzibacteria bacterium]
MPHASFVHLQVHSHYSMLAGATAPKDLVASAARTGQQHLALSDCNGAWGNVAFQKACEAAGLRAIHGVELTGEPALTDAIDAPRVVLHQLRGPRPRAVLLARNPEGWAAICRATSLRQLRPDFDLGATLRQLLVEHPHDLFVLCDDITLLRALAPLCPQRGQPGDPGALYVLLAWQECIHRPERLVGPKPPLEALKIWRHAPRVPNHRRLRQLEQLAQRLHLPTVASGDVWFAEPDGLLTQRVLSAIRTRSTLSRVKPPALAPEGAWLRSPEEMAQLFDEFPDAVRNTLAIAEACTFRMKLGTWTYPDFPLPPGESAEGFLWKVAFDGLARRFQPIPPHAMERLQEEMQVAVRLHFAEYLLVVWDIARYAHEEHIPVVGRGSAANSLLCYVLGITNIDPLAHDLFFQRFLNPERVSPPDIDLDFCWRRRDKVLRYVYERYGHDRVAMIGTINTFAARSGVREVAKTIGLSDREISPITDRLPHRSLGDFDSWQERIPEARHLPMHEEPWRSILKVGTALEGFPRHMGIHAGGIVIGRAPLTNRFPLQWARKGFVITQIDMYSMEDLGLVK